MEMKIEPLALLGVDTQRPIVIAGPCSAETEEQVLETAQGLASRGVKIFRAGIWKPRTKPGGFEGIGAEGLAWLKKVKKETGMLVSTEVATKDHVFEALKAGIDILWIGAFERLYGAGIHRLGAIHRGFSSYDKKIYRNLPLWHIPIELRRRMPDLPIFCDPSHIGGKRELVAPLCQQAMDLSFDGLIVESHCNPDCAWSDASQQITPDVLDYVLNLLVIRDVNQTTENLTALRRQIDGIDEQLLELLAKRMRISKEIGVYKKEHNMPILQSPRYSEILEKRSSMGEQMDLSPDFVKEILKEIHEESVRQQMIIMNEQ